MTSIEDRMTDYAARLRLTELPEAVVHHARRRLLDTIGGALAAYTAPPVQIARRVAMPVAGPGGSRIWGSLTPTSPDMAAFVNGTMLRYLDINDTHRTIDGSHPSDNIGGILAVAEATGASGAAFLEALIIAYEIQCRFVDSVGFDTLTTFTCFYCLPRTSQAMRFQGLSPMRSQPTEASTCLMCHCHVATS